MKERKRVRDREKWIKVKTKQKGKLGKKEYFQARNPLGKFLLIERCFLGGWQVVCIHIALAESLIQDARWGYIIGWGGGL